MASFRNCDFTNSGECAAKSPDACLCWDRGYRVAKREHAVREQASIERPGNEKVGQSADEKLDS